MHYHSAGYIFSGSGMDITFLHRNRLNLTEPSAIFGFGLSTISFKNFHIYMYNRYTANRSRLDSQLVAYIYHLLERT